MEKSCRKCAHKASPWLLCSGYKTSYVLAMYYLTKFDVNIKQLLQKLHLLIYAIYDVINSPTFICPFESGKWGAERKNSQNFDIVWWKNEQIADRSFKDYMKCSWNSVSIYFVHKYCNIRSISKRSAGLMKANIALHCMYYPMK